MAACARCGEPNDDRARFCTSCGAPLPATPAPELRKTVTVLFCDVVDSTVLGERLDPEVLRGVVARYFELARGVLERHGGTVEKFIGDAVMAVFGIPTLHEDDALRAVRAALELRDELADLNEELARDFRVRLRIRTGINTGEVLAGDHLAGQSFASGDAVVVAQRLEGAAGAGEIFIGEPTARLVVHAVRAERVGPLQLKGKAEPLPAWRVEAVDAAAPAIVRRLDSPLVGRSGELARLRGAFDDVVRERACRVVAVVAEPGVGKSRLAAELASSLGGEARVLEGRCPPYGQGITYRPVAEIVRALAGATAGDDQELASAEVLAALPADPDAELVAARLVEAVGAGDADTRSEEIFWAVRRLLELLARERPVLVVLDDLQWAEVTFLDLVDYLAGWSTGAPILVCCLTRPDLLEARPSWSGAGAVELLRLAPLGNAESRRLIANLLEGGALEPQAASVLVAVTEGNPLFVEETVRMLVEGGVLVRSNGAWRATGELSEHRVPATIQAVLAARLDALAPEERAVVQLASVIGPVFWWGAVAALSPPPSRDRVGAHLQSLVRKQLVRFERSSFAGEDAFRFSHILVRDAAYESMPKRVRADLHERLAEWIEGREGAAVAEQDEIVGYHLEQAYQSRHAVAPIDERARRLAVRAGERLAAAGRRAHGRGDGPAAVRLLGRALALPTTSEREKGELLVELAPALRDTGDLTRAQEVLEDALRIAAAIDNRHLSATALVERSYLSLYTELRGGADEVLRVIEQTIAVFAAAGDELGQSKALSLVAYVTFMRCHLAEVEDVLERSLRHAERAGSGQQVRSILNLMAHVAVVGPTPVEEAIRRCEEIGERAPGLEGVLATDIAYLEAMRGRFVEARELYERTHQVLAEQGRIVPLAAMKTYAGMVELLAGDPAAAERELRWGYETLESIGEKGNLPTSAAILARALLEQGRDDEAERFALRCAETAYEDDVMTQVSWRSVLGRVHARAHDLDEAERLARDAVSLASDTDYLNLHGDALMSLADVLATAGARGDARPLAADAAALYEAKGNTVSARRARALFGLKSAV